MRALLLASTVLLAACREAAVEAPSAPELALLSDQAFDFVHEVSDLPPDPAVRYGQLDNGLRYALRENDTPSDAASALFYIDAGSLDEAEDERGLAHFLEHMAFNGSENFPEGELVPALERLGLAFGADTNAYTTFDRTVYTLQLPNVRDETVDAALGALRETADRLLLEQDAIERERGVIQSELRARKSPSSRASEATLEFLLDGTAYPERLPIGTQDTIDSVSADQFRAFYEGRYRPENSAFVMVGDFDVDAMEARIRDTFGDWQGQGEALPIDRPDSVPERAPREGTFIDPEVSTSLDAVLLKPYAKPLDTAASRRERFLDSVGNSLLNRRFQRLATESSRDFLGASASVTPIFDIAKMSNLSVSSKPGEWDAALTDAVVELKKAREFCFTEAELAEFRANARRSAERAVETADTRRTAGLANQILSSLTGDTVLTDPESALERFTALEPAITLEEICPRFQAQWDGFENADLFLRTNAEPEAGIRSVFNDALAIPVEADTEREATEFDYTAWGEPGEVVARDYIEDIGFHTVDFANGVRLNIKRTDYAKDQVIARVSVGGGLLNGDWIEGFSQIAGPVLGEGGLGRHTVDDLRTVLAGRNVNANIGVGTDMVSIPGGSSTRDMGLLFDLLMANLTDKAYREEAVTGFRRDIDAFYDQLDSTPGGVAARDVPRILRSGDTRYGIPEKDVLKALTAEDVSQVVEPILDSGLIEIGVVGDIDPDAVISEVARTFGTLPERPTTLPEPAPEVKQLRFPEPRRVDLTHEGDADTARVQVVYPAFDDEDTARVRAAQVARDIARLKLTDVLREREGQTYSPGIGSYFSSAFPDYGYVSVTVNADPAELDAIEALIDEVAADMREGRITEDEFDRAIAPTREAVVKSLEENGYWLGVISRARTYPEDLETHRSRVSAYQNMTLKDILPVSSELFREEAAVRIRIVPSG